MNSNNFVTMQINQNNNNNLNNNEMLMNLLNQNIQMTNNLVMNNEMIKNMLNNMKNEMEKKLLNMDFFPGDDRINKMSVIFKSSEGNSIFTVIDPINIKIKELLKIFYIKYQIIGAIREQQIKKLNEFIFLFNNSIIKSDSLLFFSIF